MQRTVFLVLTTLMVSACSDRDVVGVDPHETSFDEDEPRDDDEGRRLTVMTQNMYVGAPLEPILAESDPNLVPVRVAEAWGVLLSTDFPTRARAMAEEIARNKPDLVGLQEVSLLRTQFPSDAVFGVLEPNANEVALDFLQQLVTELAARGARYRVAVSQENLDVEVPRFDGFDGSTPLFTDVRLTFSNVILAHAGVTTANAASAVFAVELPTPAGVSVGSGWVGVDATVAGQTYRFVNTHLESGSEIVKSLQAQELVSILSVEARPLVLVGDINSGPGRPADEGGQATYDFLRGPGGFSDAWTGQRGGRSRRPGFTCCHAGDLSNTQPTLTQRIDVILTRNMARDDHPVGIHVVRAWRVGERAKDRWRYGIWPSDHAGVLARLVPTGELADDDDD